MNELKIYTKLYGNLKNYGLPFFIMTPLRRFVRTLAAKRLPKFFLYNKVRDYNTLKMQEDLIVSFTSFPLRINYVWMVVQTIKRQTILPKKIILWLSKEQFPNEDIPQNLKDEIDELFEVRFVENDIRSHKKYYYAAKEFPEKYVFLIDDDILYEPDLLERIWEKHMLFPNSVISNYGFIIKYDNNGVPLPYNYWTENYRECNDASLFFGSGGGTLIKPSILYKDLININYAVKLTPIADDIWLNAMAKLANVPCMMIKHGLYLRLNIPCNIKLSSLNLGDIQNDKQIQAISEHYINQIGVNPFKMK